MEDHGADGEQVGPLVGDRSEQDLGRREERRSSLGLRASAHGETKVEQVQLAGFVQDQIAWLEIEVQDSA